MDAYESNRREANDLVLEASPVAMALLKFMMNQPAWQGNATQLLGHLMCNAPLDITSSRVWPKLPNHLSNQLSRLTNNLKAHGIQITIPPRTSIARQIRIVRDDAEAHSTEDSDDQ